MTVSRSPGILSVLGQEFPGPVDRFAFEVVAKAEVSQHLEKRLVKRRLAHVFDVAGANAFLAGGRALEVGIAQPHELFLELVHAGRREEHRRVVGHEHVAGPANAALGHEKVEKRFAKFVCFHRINQQRAQAPYSPELQQLVPSDILSMAVDAVQGRPAVIGSSRVPGRSGA